MNNFIKKLFRNFCEEFEGCSINELDNFGFTLLFNLFNRNENLNSLNKDLRIFIKDFYQFDIDDPIKFLDY